MGLPTGCRGRCWKERPHLGRLPDRATLAPYLREDRKVARDGFVSWEGSRYGVHWKWVGATVQVGQRQGTVEIWFGDERIAVHPRAQQPGRSFILPGQWSGLPKGDNHPRKEAIAANVKSEQPDYRSVRVEAKCRPRSGLRQTNTKRQPLRPYLCSSSLTGRG